MSDLINEQSTPIERRAWVAARVLDSGLVIDGGMVAVMDALLEWLEKGSEPSQ